MALVLKDRVQETTTTEGTGTITLDGAETGFQAFSAVGSGNETYYAITDNTDWEVGTGLYANVPAPALELDFSAVTSLPAGITFTRATNGTYFDSSGVLQTASSGVARFDHRLESGTWVNKGLLIEEQRTNLVQRSEEFNDAYWSKTRSSITSNAITSPDGTLTADKLVEDSSASNTHEVSSTLLTFTSGVSYAATVFFKKAERTWALLAIGSLVRTAGTENRFRQYVNLTTGATGTSESTMIVQDVGNDWFRCTLLVPGSEHSGGNGNLLIVLATGDQQAIYTGNGSSGIYVWGAQLEVGAFPTSYIKTTSASVTRNADVASMTSTNFSDWYNATEGTVFTQSTIYYNIPSGVFPRIVEFGDGTFNERIIRNYSSSLPGFRYVIVDNSNTVAAIDFTTGQPNGITSNYATAYKVNDFAGSVNGGAVGIATSGTLPTLNKVNLGTDSVSDATSINGHIAKFYYWDSRLSNGTLQFLSGTGIVDTGAYLSRTNVLSSTNSDALVNWGSGTKAVFSPLPAQATLGSAATADNSSIGTDQYAWTNFKKLLDESVIGGVAYGNNGTNGIVSTYSLVYTTTSAYTGGVLAPNGDVHFVPFSANRGQKISAAGVVSTYSLVYTTANAYSAGVLAPNGDIHFVPRTANRGQKISASGVVSTYSLVYTGTNLYRGGVLDPSGNIHFVPRTANRGQKISASGVVSTYSLVYTGTNLYCGGVLASNGDIHFIPASANVGQKISAAGVVSTYSLVYTIEEAYFGGVLSPNGDIHFVPLNAVVGQKISAAGVVSTYSLVYTAPTAYNGGVLSSNGDIHFVPRGNVGQKISVSGVVSTYSLVYTTSAAYAGGILRSDGSIVLIPESAAVGQIISTNPGIPLGQEACLSSYLNKF
jgi:hypothetical protein